MAAPCIQPVAVAHMSVVQPLPSSHRDAGPGLCTQPWLPQESTVHARRSSQLLGKPVQVPAWQPPAYKHADASAQAGPVSGSWLHCCSARQPSWVHGLPSSHSLASQLVPVAGSEGVHPAIVTQVAMIPRSAEGLKRNPITCLTFPAQYQRGT